MAIEGFVSSPLTVGTTFPSALPGCTSIRSGWSRPSAFDRVYATATEEAKSEVIGKEETWLKPALHNTPAFRAVSILSALGLAWYSTTTASNPLAAMPTKAAATIHLLAYGTWLGSAFYTTFIAGFTLFKNLPRQTFGKVQSKLFPKYFNLGAVTILLQVSCDLITYNIDLCLMSVSLNTFNFSDNFYFLCIYQLVTLAKLPSLMTTNVKRVLVTSMAMTLLNLAYLEPTATRIMFERYDLDNLPGGHTSEKYKKLAASFGKLHGLSSLANLIAFCGAVAHGFFIASVIA